MTDELREKLAAASLLEEVDAAIIEENSAAVELAMEEFAESDAYKAILEKAESTGYGKGYRVGKKGKSKVVSNTKPEETTPACYGTYKKTFPTQGKVCRSCKYAKECRNK